MTEVKLVHALALSQQTAAEEAEFAAALARSQQTAAEEAEFAAALARSRQTAAEEAEFAAALALSQQHMERAVDVSRSATVSSSHADDDEDAELQQVLEATRSTPSLQSGETHLVTIGNGNCAFHVLLIALRVAIALKHRFYHTLSVLTGCSVSELTAGTVSENYATVIRALRRWLSSQWLNQDNYAVVSGHISAVEARTRAANAIQDGAHLDDADINVVLRGFGICMFRCYGGSATRSPIGAGSDTIVPGVTMWYSSAGHYDAVVDEKMLPIAMMLNDELSILHRC